MDIIDKLAEVFKEFPGIGERQAKRFVNFLMHKNSAYAENLCMLISELKKETKQCGECFRFFIIKSSKDKVCEICMDKNMDPAVLMILEKDSDLESVKKSRVYNGKYFILGGLVPIVEKNTKSRIRINELKDKIERDFMKPARNASSIAGAGGEIILAFSLSPQGDPTNQYMREKIKTITDKQNIKISSLGRGLSTGTELEYSDN